MDRELAELHRGARESRRRVLEDNPEPAPDVRNVPGHGRPGGIDDPVPDSEYGDVQGSAHPDEEPPESVDPLCHIETCEELARYVETGERQPVQDPDKFCHRHKPEVGLWHDLLEDARELHR